MPQAQKAPNKLRRNVRLISGLICVGAFTAAHAATEGLPFKIVDYDATYTLHRNGSYTAQIHEVSSPLSQFGVQKFAQARKEYPAKLATLQVSKAYTLSPSGKMYAVPKDKIFTRTVPVAADAPEFSDAKATTVVFPHVAVGDDLVSDWRLDFKKPFFPNEATITHTVPYFLEADHVHIVVHAPASMKLHWQGTGGYQVSHTVQGNTQTISATFSQSHPGPMQVNAVSVYQVSPSFRLSTFSNWQAIGNAYWKYAEPAQEVTPQVQALADKVAGNKTGKAAAQALYDWTVHHIRWVGIETGLSGYKPYPADITLSQRYGDCKAAAALLISLLHAKGIEAQPVLLGAGNDFARPEVATLERLNHVIVYVPQYHLYLDATSGYAPMGTIPLPDAHQPVILVGDHSQLAQTPGDGPEASHMTGMEKVSVASDGSMEAKETLQLRGYGAWIWKDILARVPTSEYGALMHQVMAQGGLMPQTAELSSSPTHSLAEPFTLHASWSTAPGVPLAAGSRIHLHYGFNTASLRNLTVRLTSPTVKYPAFMPYGTAEWSSEVTLPKGFTWKATADDRQIKNAAGTFTEQVKMLSPQELRVNYHMQLAHMIYSPAEYPDLYKLVSQAYAISQQGFAVEKK